MFARKTWVRVIDKQNQNVNVKWYWWPMSNRTGSSPVAWQVV